MLKAVLSIHPLAWPAQSELCSYHMTDLVLHALYRKDHQCIVTGGELACWR